MLNNFSLRLVATTALVIIPISAALAGNVPTEMEGLLNFHEVHPFLYRGGGPSEAALKSLKDKGVKTIIDLRAPSEGLAPAARKKDDDPVQPREEKEIADKLGMKYINMTMDSHAPTKKQVKTFINAVEKAEDGGSGPVFVHCAHGSDRTGCLVGIWRVTHDNWDYDKAYAEMRKYFFTPKFTNLSSTVKSYAEDKSTHVTTPK